MPFTLDTGSRLLIQSLYPEFRTRLIGVWNSVWQQTGLSMRVTESLRSFEDQATRYAQGRSTPGPIVTHAAPGHSLHQWGLAADCCFRGADPYLTAQDASQAPWEEFGRFAEAYGLTWGGRFKTLQDRPHVEFRIGGLQAQDFLRYYQIAGLPSVWAKCDALLLAARA